MEVVVCYSLIDSCLALLPHANFSFIVEAPHFTQAMGLSSPDSHTISVPGSAERVGEAWSKLGPTMVGGSCRLSADLSLVEWESPDGQFPLLVMRVVSLIRLAVLPMPPFPILCRLAVAHSLQRLRYFPQIPRTA